MMTRQQNTPPPFFLALLCLLSSGLSLPAQTISGNVHTEANSAVEDVEVTLTGPGVSQATLSGNNGNFTFSGLPDNQAYQVCLAKNTNPLNGVTTFDAVLLNNHIMNIELLNSPYKIIAAETGTANQPPDLLDIYLMRALILGVLTDLPAPSWKFIPADAVLNPVNPFPDIPLPLNCKTINLNGNATGQDFIGVKTADLNGTAVAN